MRGTGLVISCAAAAAIGGCRSGSRNPSVSDAGVARAQDATSSAAAPSPAPATAETRSVFSAPIAATRTPTSDVVAGLVVKDRVVRVTSLPAQGTGWSSDALTAVGWTPDSELRIQRAGDGFVLEWRGLYQGKSGRTVAILGPDGKPRGEPFSVGAAFCATEEGAAWVVERPDGSSRLLARRWADAAAREAMAVSAEHDPPTLVCADHTAIVLGDADDGVTVAPFALIDAAPRPPAFLLRDADFGDDDEREHDTYSVGDDLGIVRIGTSGSVALREAPGGRDPSPWRRLKRNVPADDDVVAVDGDATGTIIVMTHDAEAACPGVGSTAAAVRALRIDRKSGDETMLELAPADCAIAPGPFWIADSPRGQVVAWVERRARSSAEMPAITGLAYRVVRAAGASASRIDTPSDALADGGCDARGCSVAALVRSPGADATEPSSIRVLHYAEGASP